MKTQNLDDTARRDNYKAPLLLSQRPSTSGKYHSHQGAILERIWHGPRATPPRVAGASCPLY
eukprot:11762-Karenia_brevis.AAC.1